MGTARQVTTSIRAGVALVLGWCLLLGSAGCAGEGSYRLRLVFPGQEERELVDSVVIWALDPGGHDCQELAADGILPEQLRKLSKVEIAKPFEAEALLSRVPVGEVLFVAEGRTAGGARLLRACSEARVKGGATVEVTLELVCVCNPQGDSCEPSEELVGNGIDDDCDGLTDECTADADCDDGNGCTADTCLDGGCHHTDYPDGLQCSDGDACTKDDSCSGGVCTGVRKDCGALDGVCVEGVCNSETGACEQRPADDGTACDDGNWCTENDACAGGQCMGTARDCGDGDDCTADGCNEDEDECEHVLQPNPGAEGPPSDASCTDGADNDCDGLTDGDDPNCSGCTADAECDDGNKCTDDECLATECHNTPVADETPCADDGLFCNGTERCQGGVCVHGGNPCTGPDGDGDCAESCDEAADDCSGADPDGSACDDGNWCTVNDACAGGQCMGTARDCGDGDDCTADTCDDGNNVCDHALQPNPGAEGPVDDATCGNGVDDDCDGLIDNTDTDCFQSYALRFDGVDDVVRITQDDSILSETHFGVLLDFSTEGTLKSYACVASHHGFGADVANNRWVVGFEPGDNSHGLTFSTSNGTTQYHFFDLVPLSECYNKRFQLLGTVDATTGNVKLIRYDNGTEIVLLEDSSFSGSINTKNLIYDMLIGNTKEGTYASTFFNGTVRQLAVFNYSAFTDTDRNILFNEPNKLKDFVVNNVDHGFSFQRDDVIDLMDFNIGHGHILPNLCDNANGDGILENFPDDDSQWVQE